MGHTNFGAHDLTVVDTAWMARAACRNSPVDMFPTDTAGFTRARKVCERCPVTRACLAYALDNRIDHGTWGGTSERERRQILRQRREGAA